MPLIVEVKVVPLSGRAGCKREGNRLKCYLKSAPERGKANAELIALIAKKAGMKASALTIVSGATSRLKRLKIDSDTSFDALCDALGIERQRGLF